MEHSSQFSHIHPSTSHSRTLCRLMCSCLPCFSSQQVNGSQQGHHGLHSNFFSLSLTFRKEEYSRERRSRIDWCFSCCRSPILPIGCLHSVLLKGRRVSLVRQVLCINVLHRSLQVTLLLACCPLFDWNDQGG